MNLRARSIVLPALAAGALAACHKQQPAPAPTPTPTPVTTPTTQAPPPAPVTTNRPTVDPNAAANAAAAEVARIKVELGKPIYFDYDKSELRDDSRATLEAKVPYLQRFRDLRIRIAGNTDERGSDEYNLALGQRRAAAARSYLKSLGIDENRVDIVSFGEERPAMSGHEESAWSKNRRDEFDIVAGAESIKPTAGP